MEAGAQPAPREAGISAGNTGPFTPAGPRDGDGTGTEVSAKQVPREEGRAEGSFVEERRDEGSAGR